MCLFALRRMMVGGFRSFTCILAVIGTLAAFMAVGCRKDTDGAATSRALPLSSRPVAPSRDAGIPALTHTVAVSLGDTRAELVLPAGWQLLPDQSDESVGLVAFGIGPQRAGMPEQVPSAFLDGTSEGAVTPRSLSDAEKETLIGDRTRCKTPVDCTVLGREVLPGGGYLVTIKSPQAVFAQSWHPSQRRSVRCGAEISAPSSHSPSTWINDPQAVKTARDTVEGICRSVKLAR